ncbi:MotA/TolQ/ExbB proton channel family protein [Bremerella cremea]|uniref:MotA/TolQ/ExbB proton channel family protein n=1 Tax=Bremerella cremea TaxID=1031537 RepID=A0A368KPN3_9BACT|nr:MotA/TolQ/ExbB proton channel family protein [Bremerella cremea]RCS47620.1 MotA/TolQ/ExbB proton channel family protein [Bremerella cremea]
MNTVTNLFYVLSNALLIPVMILLLVSLARVLVQCGRTLQEFIARSRERTERQQLERFALENRSLVQTQPTKGPLGRTLHRLIVASDNIPGLAYTLSQIELEWQMSLDRIRGLVKLGPSLGLMGTLIPLGPALVGLAVGDIQTMSNNLVIAFSTTVLGLFIGMVAGWLATVKKHWYQADSALLNLLAERISGSLGQDLSSTVLQEQAALTEEQFAQESARA